MNNAALTVEAGLQNTSFSHAFRSKARALGVRSVLSSARKARKMLNDSRAKALLRNIQRDLAKTSQKVEAEVEEFVTSPHLLFKPVSIIFTLLLPLAIPLYFMPTSTLVLFCLFVLVWYVSAVCFFATEVAMRPPWYQKGLGHRDLPPYWKGFVHDPLLDLGTPFESVEFANRYGVTLRGWFIPAPPPGTLPRSATREFAPSPPGSDCDVVTERADDPDAARNMVVCVHGAGRDRRNFLRHAAAFLERGWPVLLFDVSEHGLSDGASPHASRGTAFGAREQHDVVAAADYLLNRRGARKVAIVGSSAGASSSILAAALRPGLAHCVVAENPFTRPDDLLTHHLEVLSENYLSQNSTRTVRAAVFWLAGRILVWRLGMFTPRGAVDAAPKLDCPLLVAHSTADDIVPYKQGRAIYEAAAKAKRDKAGMVEFLKVHDAAHCALYDKDPRQWTGAVVPFLERGFAREI